MPTIGRWKGIRSKYCRWAGPTSSMEMGERVRQELVKVPCGVCTLVLSRQSHLLGSCRFYGTYRFRRERYMTALCFGTHTITQRPKPRQTCTFVWVKWILHKSKLAKHLSWRGVRVHTFFYLIVVVFRIQNFFSSAMRSTWVTCFLLLRWWWSLVLALCWNSLANSTAAASSLFCFLFYSGGSKDHQLALVNNDDPLKGNRFLAKPIVGVSEKT